MREVLIEEFVKCDFIKELNNAILINAVGDKLTDKSILKILQDRANLFWLYGFSYGDLSKIDLSELSYDVFSQVAFSTYTKFPEKFKLPKYFDPNKEISEALNSCYRFKVDDNNCTIAIIDNPTQFYLHQQFKDLNYVIIDYSKKDAEAHFHGEGVLSNIASKDFGYGQNAKYLFYVVDWESCESRLASHLQALQDVCKRIEIGEKIQVVSISNLLIDKKLIDSENAKKVLKMVELLKNNSHYRCEVVDSMRFSVNGFQPVYCRALDKPDIENYCYSYNSEKDIFGVPINKIEPLFGSKNGYKVANNSLSVSWAIPIISYFYAVCRQYVNLTFDEYVKICQRNYNKNKNGVIIIDFETIVNNIKNNKK